MSFDYVSFVGFCVSITSVVMSLPQFLKTWRLRDSPVSLLGVSATGQWVHLLNAVGWFYYAWLIGDIWVGLPGIVAIPCCTLTLVLLRRAKKFKADSAP